MIRRTIRRCWYVLAGVIILLAVLMTSGRFLTPLVDGYRQALARTLSDGIGQRVAIGALSARWHGLGPWLVMRRVRLLGPPGSPGGSGPTLARVDEVEIGLNLWNSLRNARLTFDEIHLRGGHLHLQRDRHGGIGMLGLNRGPDDTGGADVQEALAWLLAQGRILIDHSEIGWSDESRPGREMRFDGLSIDIRNDGDRHQITIEGGLPLWLGERIRLAVDITGSPQDAANWRTRAYLDGRGLSLPAWLDGRQLAGLFVSDGEADVRAWGEWRGTRLMSLAGTIEATNGRIDAVPQAETTTGTPRSYAFDGLESRFVWADDAPGWRLAVPLFRLTRDGRASPPSRLGVHRAGDAWDVVAESLEITDLADLARIAEGLPAGIADHLDAAQPAGLVASATVHWADTAPLAAAIELADVTIHPSAELPGLVGLSGRIVTDGRVGHAEIAIDNGRLEFPGLFRAPLPVDRLTAALDWRLSKDGLDLAAPKVRVRNEDLEAEASLGLRIPNAGPPLIRLEGDYRTGSVARTGRYLPARIMPVAAVDWLDVSIVDGHVTKGHVSVEGALDRFPFERGGGRFRVTFRLEDGILGFYPGWPRIEGLVADVVFNGNGMRIEARRGHSGRIELEDVEVEIDALDAPDSHLEVRGRARGPTDATLKYLLSSPLAGLLGDYGRTLTASGTSDLELDLDIPFHEGETRIRGSLGLHDTRLDIADGALTIDAIEGRLRFTGDDLRAEGVGARILGLDCLVDVSRGHDPLTRIRARGRVTADDVWRLAKRPPAPWLHGHTDWLATLELPDPEPSGTPPRLSLESTLRDMAIDLPPPLRKAASENRPLRLSLALPPEAGSRVDLALGETLRGLIELDGDRRPGRMTLHWGDGSPRLPERPGLRLSGRLAALSIAPWLDLLETLPDGPTDAPMLDEIEMRIDALDLSSLTVHGLALNARFVKDAYAMEVASQEITGHIDWPRNDGERPIVMTLSRLALPDIGGDASDPLPGGLRPTTLPAIHVEADAFAIGPREFGRLALVADRVERGLRLERLEAGSQEMAITGHGEWLESEAGSRSRFSFRLETRDLGGTLARLGYAGTISKGHGTMELSAEWPGGPGDFDWRGVDGRASLLIQDGRLLDVEPGAGRIFGLLSLNALPRRLILDFSDVFRSGLAFDRIEGDFVIEQGRARTDNLYLDGPAARVEVKGVTDLAARLYEQEVTVTPHIGSSLPVAGALAGGPAVGAAVFLAERIFRHDIAKLTRIRYRMTGPWNAPEIVTIQKERTDRPRKRRRP